MSISYNSEFLTTYRSFKEEYYSDLCYKIQLLQAFNMMKYDDFIIQKNIQKLYNFLKENKELKVIYEILSKNNKQYELIKELILNDKTNKELSEDIINLFFFQILFSFDYFNIMHKCLSKYLNDLLKNQNNIDSLYFEELKQYILNN